MLLCINYYTYSHQQLITVPVARSKQKLSIFFYLHKRISITMAHGDSIYDTMRKDGSLNDTGYEYCIPSSPSFPPKPQSSISFYPDIFVVDYLHIRDYTSEEVNSTWYSNNDFSIMRNDAKELLRRVCRGEVDPQNEEHCTRGLEGRTSEGKKQRLRNTVDASSVVFVEQEIQDEEGIRDPDFLATFYFDNSHHCQVAANMMGLLDEKAARDVMSNISPLSESKVTIMSELHNLFHLQLQGDKGLSRTAFSSSAA
jgi:hypothetical protein